MLWRHSYKPLHQPHEGAADSAPLVHGGVGRPSLAAEPVAGPHGADRAGTNRRRRTSEGQPQRDNLTEATIEGERTFILAVKL